MTFESSHFTTCSTRPLKLRINVYMTMYLGRYWSYSPVIGFQNESLKSDFNIWHTLSKSWSAILTSDLFVSRVDCCPMFEFLCWWIPICGNHCCPIWFWTFDIQVSTVECRMVTFDDWACLKVDFWNCLVTCTETTWHLRLDAYSWKSVAKIESWCFSQFRIFL